MIYPRVLSEDETLAQAYSRSLARFGDGELRIATGKGCSSQEPSEGLTNEFREILAGRSRALPCLPNIFGGTPRQKSWEPYAHKKYTRWFSRKVIYGSAFITRPDSMPHIDRPDYWDKVRGLWRHKDTVLVRGDEKSLTASMLQEAARVREVIGPRVHAYQEIDRIEEEISLPSGPVILCLGATATALAHRLAQKGVHALDLGHIGMFMRHAGAYVVPLEKLASRRYRDLLKQKHTETKWGNSGKSHADEIVTFASAIGAQSVLDYGCGRGTLKTALEGTLRVQEYDPGIPGKDGFPKPCDMVVATDVLEHVEPDLLDSVLKHIFLLAGKGIFLVIAKGPAKAILPDGRNAHLIQKDTGWWLDKLRESGYDIHRAEDRKGLVVWVRK